MNPIQVGKFIKDLRKKNNLTQKQFADKYGVTYQAVSKWENGLNIPEVSLLMSISKDFNVNIESILDGKVTPKKSNKIIWFIIILCLIIISIIALIIHNNTHTFNFKTISTTCDEFKVTGSIAYNHAKSSIYISEINYCGGSDTKEYKEITCSLYETKNDIKKEISSCQKEENITLEKYLKEVEINIDNYSQMCKTYEDNSLFLEISALDTTSKVITYKIPLSLNQNCTKK